MREYYAAMNKISAAITEVPVSRIRWRRAHVHIIVYPRQARTGKAASSVSVFLSLIYILSICIFISICLSIYLGCFYLKNKHLETKP